MSSSTRWILGPIVAVAMALAQAPALTTIQDILYTADGRRYNGQITITWKSFETAENSNVPAQSQRLAIVNGNLFVQLTPTESNGAGAYMVQYSAGKALYTEYWAVPASSTPVHVRDIRLGPGAVTTPGASGGPPPGGAVSVQIGDVSGLQSALNLRPSIGTGFGVSRAAVINALGAIDGAVGNLGDCVHVDGSAGPCSSPGSGGGVTFADSEIPTGAVNGINASFVLAATPDPASSLALYRNGVLLRSNSDYTLSGRTLTFQAPAIPQTGDVLLASYRLAGTLPGVTFVDQETPSGSVNGINTSFALSQSPSPSTSLAVYRNGIRQKPGTDYTNSSNSVTFTPASVPQSGDILLCSYRIGQ